jgi:NADPH:quinone reductase-like Zn-dependent oxidoreductase
MRAMQVHSTQQGMTLVAAELPRPEPGDGEILIRVHAAGVTPTELLWYPTTHTKEGAPRAGAVPGHEFSGVVAAVGENAGGFHAGDAVYGMNDWFANGATAEFCITVPQNIAQKPAALTHEAAAAVPIGALTAWQGLFDRARIQPGEHVLVHGGAGSVGLFAIQLAHLHGARVSTTVSARNMDFVKQLGADVAIDYNAVRFEEKVAGVDVVFDAVGGEILDRSWNVLRPGGRVVTIAADSEGTADQRVKDAFFIVEPKREQLLEVAKMLDEGRLKSFVNAVVSFDEAAAAYNGSVSGKRGYGKVVIALRA